MSSETMKELPILFNTEMVRAVLAGQKTQTRRPVKPQPDITMDGEIINQCGPGPFGKPGDKLWVRESIRKVHSRQGEPIYRADIPDDVARDFAWKPSIHMPRWASRITLEVKRVWDEKVQDISQQDIFAEGWGYCGDNFYHFSELWDSIYAKPRPVKRNGEVIHYVSYPWESTFRLERHKGTLWHVHSNPWVWCCEFKRI